MPAEMKYVGNRYLNQEFRLHVKAEAVHLNAFITEWQSYKNELESQMNSNQLLGKKLEIGELEGLSPDKVGQLWELRDSSKKIK